MSLAVFIIVIDTTIMNVAITALVHDLNTNIENEKFFWRYDTLLHILSYNFSLHAKEEIVRVFRFQERLIFDNRTQMNTDNQDFKYTEFLSK